MSRPYRDSLDHLQGALLLVTLRLHRQVLRWRATHHDQATPDELAGLYITDADVDVALDGLYAAHVPGDGAAPPAPIVALTELLDGATERHRARERASRDAGTPLRLVELAARLGLDDFERGVVVLAAAAEFDRRFERLFGFLSDDATYRLPSVDLALRMWCSDRADRAQRLERFGAGGPLVDRMIVELIPPPSPLGGGLAAHGFRLDPRIARFLVGSDAADAALAGRARLEPARAQPPALAAPVAAELDLLAGFVRGRAGREATLSISGPDAGARRAAAAYLAGAWRPGTPVLVVALAPDEPEPALLRRAGREAALVGAALAVEVADADGPRPAAPVHAGGAGDGLQFVLGRRPPPLGGAGAPLLNLDIPMPSAAIRQRLWSAALNGCAADVDVGELADRYRLTTDQIGAAAQAAAARATARGAGLVDRADLVGGCRAQPFAEIDGLVDSVESIHSWDDLVLPAGPKGQLRGLEHWVRHRPVVYDDWGFADRIMLGRGLTVLFSGPSGTGKTMAAGILARRLELELFRIDLSTVVSKYIGETEKNLSRVFDGAQSANAVLFFDEADALFGKRSEVKDAHDRYANIEVSYLLQRMEAYDGVAILATNFRDNLDAAFTRRIHVTVEFPFPHTADRDRIWRALLPAAVPQADDVNLAFLARQFPLAGGGIRNCAVSAAFAAAADGGVVRMQHLVRAVAAELDKAKQPVVESSFGRYYRMLERSGERR